MIKFTIFSQLLGHAVAHHGIRTGGPELESYLHSLPFKKLKISSFGPHLPRGSLDLHMRRSDRIMVT